MGILSKVLIHPQQRYDLEDYLADQEAYASDYKFWTRQFLSAGSYVLKGFEVTGLGAPSPVSVNMTDATLINANNSGDFSWFTSEVGASPISVVLQPGQRNYLEIELTTEDGVPLPKAFWDPSGNGGDGIEFTQTVDTITDIRAEIIVNTSGFTGAANRIPIAYVDTNGSNSVVAIRDKRNLFFRLGTPSNPANSFAWGTQTEPGNTLVLSGVSGTFTVGETVNFSGGASAKILSGTSSPLVVINMSSDSFAVGNTVTGASSAATGTLVSLSESFSGADKNIENFKDMIDALMTEIRRVKGTEFWFNDYTQSVSGAFKFLNSLVVPHSSASNPTMGWTGSAVSISDSAGSPSDSDILAKIRLFGTSQDLSLTREDGTGGSSTIAVADGSVLWVELPTSGNRTYSGTGSGSTNYRVTARASFVSNESNYWLAYREGTRLIVRGIGELEAGEEEQIGDQTSVDLLTALGLNETDPTPNYTSTIRGVSGESFLDRISTLTDAMGDEQEDRSAYLRSDQPIIWTGTQLQFPANIVLELINTKSGTLTAHTILTANSPITINNGESVYVSISRTTASENVTPVRSSVTPIPAQTQANKDIFVLFRRNDAAAGNFLHIPFHKQVLRQGQSVFLGASGSGSGITKVTFHDPISTTLPTGGVSITIDGVSGVNGDRVLYTNLSSNNNRVYELSGVGSSIAWTAVYAFETGLDPADGDMVISTKGDSFADQIGKYTGTAWVFNKTTRYFDGLNYVEFESIKTSTLTNNTTGNVFSVSASSSENWVVHFSLVRGSNKEVGTLWMTQDGSVARITRGEVSIGSDTGVSFTADINAGNLRLRYTLDNQGIDATMKYFYFRWSDSVGGPGGVPTYTGASSSPVTAAGATGDVQFKDSGGGLAANSKFNWDNSNERLNLNGLQISPLQTGITLNNNVISPTTFLSYNAASFPFVIIEFSVARGTSRRVGRMLIANDGTVTAFNDDSVETGSGTGVIFSATISGGNVELQYTSDNSGASGTFKHSYRRWA